MWADNRFASGVQKLLYDAKEFLESLFKDSDMPKSRGVVVRRNVTETTRRCRTCNEEKSFDQFHSHIKRDRPHRPDSRYYASDCKACAAERNRIYLYGVTLAQMIIKQGSALCPLCKKRMANCLDHDHRTGKARGALCQTCNKAMHYMDNAEWRARAEEYRASQK